MCGECGRKKHRMKDEEYEWYSWRYYSINYMVDIIQSFAVENVFNIINQNFIIKHYGVCMCAFPCLRVLDRKREREREKEIHFWDNSPTSGSALVNHMIGG